MCSRGNDDTAKDDFLLLDNQSKKMSIELNLASSVGPNGAAVNLPLHHSDVFELTVNV